VDEAFALVNRAIGVAETAEIKVSGSTSVDTPDGPGVGERQLAGESDLAIFDMHSDCSADGAFGRGWSGWSSSYRSF